MNLNISPSPFTVEQQINGDIHQNPFSCQFLYNSMQNHTAGYCDHQLYQLQHRQQDGYFGFCGESSSYNIKNKAEEDHHVTDHLKSHTTKDEADHNQVQFVLSKISLMQKKMKNWSPNNWSPNNVNLKLNSSVVNMIDDQKKIPTSVHSWETDSSSGISYNNPPIRVCSDCNTTKTPLWRGGPKGPKSLCNACGIRQRKARRAAAMAAASAEANGVAAVLNDETPSFKTTIKLKKKEKTSKKGKASNFKKHCKMAAGSSSNGDIRKKIDLEDFLINLSKNLAFRFRVFPQDEKDAAILLMALSSGLIHG